ncbi:hypothetical protein BC937DRAFT_93485 [Endogone sp. FLAS-F59071]|nr:hypothetical protein BC937DRAFT_93485 [Endogone sp. FLAS-F59071]|eukprot:RUS14678.1 hypothetical protein BC937DRAFT_93485 [Endogone sp. FLAS-F59071]
MQTDSGVWIMVSSNIESQLVISAAYNLSCKRLMRAFFPLKEMASEYPNSQFIGIDCDSYVLPTAIMPKNSDFENVNVLDSLPYVDGSFDFVHICDMLIAFSVEEWSQVLRECTRVTKPGGWIEYKELYGDIYNKGPTTQKVLIGRTNRHSKNTEILQLIASIPDTHNSSIQVLDVPMGSYGGETGRLYKEDWGKIASSIKHMVLEMNITTLEEWDENVDTMLKEFEEHKTYANYCASIVQKK